MVYSDLHKLSINILVRFRYCKDISNELQKKIFVCRFVNHRRYFYNCEKAPLETLQFKQCAVEFVPTINLIITNGEPDLFFFRNVKLFFINISTYEDFIAWLRR